MESNIMTEHKKALSGWRCIELAHDHVQRQCWTFAFYCQKTGYKRNI